jgi:hypothetical protein
MMVKEEKEKPEETENERRVKYRKLRAGGMSDKDSSESVWPTTSKGMLKNAKEKADADKAKSED